MSVPDPSLRYAIGLDLGQSQDYSALALMTWHEPGPITDARLNDPEWRRQHTRGNPPYGPQLSVRPEYNIPTLKRWPLGTSYRSIASGVAKFMAGLTPTLVGPILVADATGVGVAVCESLKEEIGAAGTRGAMACVTITGGSSVTQVEGRPGHWNVAKKQLVSILQVLLGNRRLHVAPALPEAKTLVRELGTFQVKITAAGNESFESWRERDHDDLVLAVALAAFAAETFDWSPPTPAPRRVVT